MERYNNYSLGFERRAFEQGEMVECVPNFSEGRNRSTIQKIGDAIIASGARLLHVDTGYAANRTVFTIVGKPALVAEAAFQAIRVAQANIDMSLHTGKHPRIGACDVCPFVPIAGTSMEECIGLARKLGSRVGEELGIPVYLYEEAATNERRKNLASVRSGEYENMSSKLADNNWQPDFGPNQFSELVKKSGATIIGARNFLLAYNINLDTKDAELATKIAKRLRESGEKVRDLDGAETRIPGRFQSCKAIGWYIEDYNCAQISTNLTNFRITNLHHVFDAAVAEAARLGTRVTGSEIVGMVPLEALLRAGMHYRAKRTKDSAQYSDWNLKEAEGIHASLVDSAISCLGLNELAPFDTFQKVLEYALQKPLTRL